MLGDLDGEFNAIYAKIGHPILPETLFNATALKALYSIFNERAFCERLTTTCRSSGSWTRRLMSGLSTRLHSRRTVCDC